MRVLRRLPSASNCPESGASLKPTQLRFESSFGRFSPHTCDTKPFARPSVDTTQPPASASLTSACADDAETSAASAPTTAADHLLLRHMDKSFLVSFFGSAHTAAFHRVI